MGSDCVSAPLPVRIVAVPPATVPGAWPGGDAPEAWRPALLERVGDVFCRAAIPSDLAAEVAGALVEFLADWSLLVPGRLQSAEAQAVLAIRPDLARRLFPEPMPTRATLLPDPGLAARLPLTDPFLDGAVTLRLGLADRAVDLPATAVVGHRIGSPQFRLGSLLVGRAYDGARFGDPEVEMIRRIARQASTGLENAELARLAHRAALARDAVVGIVAHDITTPLNALSLILQRAMRSAEGTAAEDRLRGLVDEGRRSLDQIRCLTADLTDLRDIEQGLFATRLTRQPVCELLRETLAGVADVALDHDIELRVDTDPCPLQVVADRGRIIQCLRILLLRAIHGSPRGSVVRILPRKVGERAEVVVHDDGPPIAPHRLPHLFDAFARGPDGSRQGLRLMIAQEIARAHGEPLEVESQPGHGTRFVLSLAVAREGDDASGRPG